MPELESLLAHLLARQFEFIVVGGFAAVAHGVTLLTEDLDVCCPFTPENLRRLEAALSSVHPVHRMVPGRPPFRLAELDLAALKNLYLDTDWGGLDCLSSIKGVGDYAAVRAQSIQAELPAGTCRIIGIDALIRAKEAMDASKDRLALIQLRAIRERSGHRQS
jgi:hypothetical protein